MAKDNDLSAQAKQLGQQALRLANTARVQAGRYAQKNSAKVDGMIDKATSAVGAKTGKDHRGAASKVKQAAAKGAALLASDSSAQGRPGHYGQSGQSEQPGQVGPAASWPDTSAPGQAGGRADMPTIPTEPLGDMPQDTLPDGRDRDSGGAG
ncbi:MAG: hypothetical protein Q4P32_06340 [Micrococcales bacterium]|nr:hypothetical protein [Micrococcales bacterium]